MLKKNKDMKSLSQKLSESLGGGIDFSKNFEAKASITELKKIGWEFDYDSVVKAQNMSHSEAEKYMNKNYSVLIQVDSKGKTSWYYAPNKGNEGTTAEPTGDDKQTIKDLEKLHKSGKLWDVKNTN